MIVVEEVAAIEGGGKESYLEAVRTSLAPLVAGCADARLVFLGSTIGSTGAWPETIVQFELDGWDAWGRFVAALADDAELRAWRETSTPLRARARWRTLVAAPHSPSFAALRERGVEGKAYSFARWRAAPGRTRELAAALVGLADGERSAGRELVGVFEVAFAEREVAAVWGHRDLSAIAARASAPPPTAARLADDRSLVAGFEERWAFAAPGTGLWPRAETTDVRVW